MQNETKPKSFHVETIDRQQLTASDLAEEAALAGTIEGILECYLITVADSPEKLQMIWWNEIGRAGISWGADAQWTSAESPQDALERFFGIDDKEMED